MISAWYHLLLDTLKQKPDPNLDFEPETVIDLGDKIKGVYQHKLRHWFGADTMLYKVPVHRTEEGVVDWDALDFDPNDVTATWSKPSSGDIYVLEVEGHKGPDYKKNFEGLGLVAEGGPKLFKRLKRAFGVLTIGSSRHFNYNIIKDEKKAPVLVTDGMAFAQSTFLSKMARRKVKQGDTFQYSMLVPEGLTKGTVVAMDYLRLDVIVPGMHNVKTELRSTGKQLFCLEGFEEPKTGKTDFQTMINNGLYPLFKKEFYAEMEHLVAVTEDEQYAADVYWKEYASKDWYSQMWQSYLRRRENNPNAKRPPFEYKPRLTAAHEMEIDARVSPTLWKDLVKWCCGRVNIQKLKVPVQNSCRAYMIPDLSQFNCETGEFAPNPETVLKAREIAFPGNYVSLGPVAVVRQPNGLGEAVVAINRRAHIESQGVQISPLAADPNMASVYGMKALDKSVMEIHGGADNDDSMIGFGGEAVKLVLRALKKFRKLGLPQSNMEDIIDQAAQCSEAPWTVAGQLYAALSRLDMSLGAAVNFMMALTLVEDWEYYRYAAQAKNAAELHDAQEQYLHQEEIPKYPDCWHPEDRFERDPYARLPIETFDSKETIFAYFDAGRVETEAGKLMFECGHDMNEFLELTFEHKFLDQRAFISSDAGTRVIRSSITRLGLSGTRMGLALWAIYLKLTGRDPEYRGEYQSLIDSYEVLPFDGDISVQDKKREFGVVANQILVGHTDAEKLAATAQFALRLLSPQKRWHGPEGEKRPLYGAFGSDAWLFTPSRNQDYSLVMNGDNLEHGLMHYWLIILKKFCETQNL